MIFIRSDQSSGRSRSEVPVLAALPSSRRCRRAHDKERQAFHLVSFTAIYYIYLLFIWNPNMLPAVNRLRFNTACETGSVEGYGPSASWHSPLAIRENPVAWPCLALLGKPYGACCPPCSSHGTAGDGRCSSGKYMHFCTARSYGPSLVITRMLRTRPSFLFGSSSITRPML